MEPSRISYGVAFVERRTALVGEVPDRCPHDDAAAADHGQPRGGRIVNVIGTGGKMPTPTPLAGGAANAALMLATAGLAAAWGPRGIRINAVDPGATLTDRLAGGLAAEARLQGRPAAQVLADTEARMPLGRIARPEEVADVVLFLASARSSFVSGAILTVDGAATPMVV